MSDKENLDAASKFVVHDVGRLSLSQTWAQIRFWGHLLDSVVNFRRLWIIVSYWDKKVILRTFVFECTLSNILRYAPAMPQSKSSDSPDNCEGRPFWRIGGFWPR